MVTQDEAQSQAKRIEQESIRLSEMVDDLFEISKINAGAVTAPYERVALDEVLDDVRNIHHISAERAGVILAVDLPPTPIRVIGSDRALVRVLSNLVANAIAHTPPGGRVSLSMGADMAGRGSGWMTPGSASPTPTYRGYSTSPIADPTTGCRGRTRHCPADRDWAWRSRQFWCGHTAARCRRAICPPARVSKCGLPLAAEPGPQLDPFRAHPRVRGLRGFRTDRATRRPKRPARVNRDGPPVD